MTHENRRTVPLSVRRLQRGFTILELVVSIGASAIILGALVASAMALRRGIHGTQVYATAYAEQHRLHDYLSRDMRRAILLSVTDETGEVLPVGKGAVSVKIADRSSLVLQIPGYYATADPMDDSQLPVVGSAERLDYGTAEKLAEPVTVCFRKIYCASEGSVCFVREEEGRQEVIVRDADDLTVEVSLAGNLQSGVVNTWYRSQSTAVTPIVATHDFVLLRNLPLTYKP